MSDILRIATRQSRLALWQAQWVAQLLSEAHEDLMVELVPIFRASSVWAFRWRA